MRVRSDDGARLNRAWLVDWRRPTAPNTTWWSRSRRRAFQARLQAYGLLDAFWTHFDRASRAAFESAKPNASLRTRAHKD